MTNAEIAFSQSDVLVVEWVQNLTVNNAAEVCDNLWFQ